MTSNHRWLERTAIVAYYLLTNRWFFLRSGQRTGSRLLQHSHIILFMSVFIRHNNISVTLGIYTALDKKYKKKKINRLDAYLKKSI